MSRKSTSDYMNTAAAHISTNLLALQTVLKLGSYKMAWHRCFDLIAQADRIGIFLIPGMEESIDMDRLDSTNNRQPSDMSLGSLPHGICQNRQLAEGMLARPYHRIDSWRRECWPPISQNRQLAEGMLAHPYHRIDGFHLGILRVVTAGEINGRAPWSH